VSRRERITKELLVEPGTDANIAGRDPAWTGGPEFEQLSDKQLNHTAKALPERGRIGIFNRSHYEEVVALRVHPGWLQAQKLPPGPRGSSFWAERHEDINSFERHLDRNGTKIVKFFLNVSNQEQKRRFLARLDNPDKQWKFSAADLAEPEGETGRP
jgi:polyphosphate kinase 2 (PPK2 family)